MYNMLLRLDYLVLCFFPWLMLNNRFFYMELVVNHRSYRFVTCYRLLLLSGFGRGRCLGHIYIMYYNKVFIDSTYRATGSISTSNFTAELKESVNLPEHTGCIVTDICIPKTFTTVTDRNNKLYFRVRTTATTTVTPTAPKAKAPPKLPPIATTTTSKDYVAELPVQHYTVEDFSNALETAMNSSSGSNVFTCKATTGRVEITSTVDFQIFTDVEVASRVDGSWTGVVYNVSSHCSMNGLIGHNTSKPLGKTFVTGYVNLRGVDYIYLVSSRLSTFNNIGPLGESSILKKIIVGDTGYGELVKDMTCNTQDYTDVSRGSLRSIDIKLVYPDGTDVDVHGSTFSFSLLFVRI